MNEEAQGFLCVWLLPSPHKMWEKLDHMVVQVQEAPDTDTILDMFQLIHMHYTTTC
jgi:hypothetical protein